MEEFIKIFEDLLEKESNSVKSGDHFRDYPEWDSLAMLGLGALIDENYGIVIPRLDFEKINTVQEIFDYIQKHKG